ncbi:MAG TPA: hypothetical protein VFG84_03605 [Gemmatimonadaceae bacterium]|nr:hypothetical protein [Gemmatimonadaceae bacterium]
MLAFLDGLCAALLARDQDEIRRLLRHPFARALPRTVREEALLIARAGSRGFMAPIQTLRLYHQTSHLLGACSDVPGRRFEHADVAHKDSQIELFVA